MLRKIQTFRYVFKKSITDTSYYSSVIKTSFWFSLKYLFFLIFVTFLFQTLLFAINAAFFLPELPSRVQELEHRLRAVYPEDLVITIEDGTLQINKDTPHFIDVPELTDGDMFDHVVTFDTDAGVEDYDGYDTIILATDNAIVYPDQQRGGLASYRVLSLDELQEDVTITQEDYTSFVNRLNPVFTWFPRIAPLLLIVGVILIPFVGAAFSAMGQLVFLLFMTGILWIVSRAFNTQLTYANIYQMGLHGLTVPIVLTFLLGLLGLNVPLLFTSAFLLWMVIVLSRKEVTS